MIGYGRTEICPMDLSIDLSDKNEMKVDVLFTIFMLPSNSPAWRLPVDRFDRSNESTVLVHEWIHCEDVLLWVKPELEKIEAKWKSGKLSDKQAIDECKKAFAKAKRKSTILRDHLGFPVQILFNWAGCPADWISIEWQGLFWVWICAPHLPESIK